MDDTQTTAGALWQQRLGAPLVAWVMTAARMPERGLVLAQRDGALRLCRWAVATGEVTPLDLPASVLFGLLAPDGGYIYYLADEKGSEVGHYVRVPYAGGPAQDLTPDLPPYSSLSFQSLKLSADGTRLAFTGADAAGFHTYVLDLGPGDRVGVPQAIFHTPHHSYGPTLSTDGTLAVVASTGRGAGRQYHLTAVETATGTVVGDLGDADSSVQPIRFAPAPGDPRLLASTNRSGQRRPLIWNPRSGERADLNLPALPGELVPLDWAPDGRTLLLCQFDQAAQRLHTYDLPTGALTHLDHAEGTVLFEAGIESAAQYGPDGAIWTLWEDAAQAPRLVALEPATGALQRTVLAAGVDLPGQPFRSVRFPSSDGQMVQGWLGTPAGRGPFPAVIEMHGGPHVMIPNAFHPIGQAWIDHGYAFFCINYRGSTTFGRAFQEQIWGDLGHWEVEDMAAARAWLVAQGIAHPDQVFLTGASYGGYLTLLGLGRQPELWAGGVALVAVADLPLWYEEASATLRGAFAAMLGGTPAERPAVYARSSPSTYAAAVRAPVYIIQGRNDTRCPARQMEAYVARLRTLGKDVTITWFDAGHGSGDTEQLIADLAGVFAFVERIRGRAPGPPETG